MTTTPLSNVAHVVLAGAYRSSATVRVHVRRWTTGQPDHFDGRVVGWAALHSNHPTRQLILSVQLAAHPRCLVAIAEHNIRRVELIGAKR